MDSSPCPTVRGVAMLQSPQELALLLCCAAGLSCYRKQTRPYRHDHAHTAMADLLRDLPSWNSTNFSQFSQGSYKVSGVHGICKWCKCCSSALTTQHLETKRYVKLKSEGVPREAQGMGCFWIVYGSLRASVSCESTRTHPLLRVVIMMEPQSLLRREMERLQCHDSPPKVGLV